MRNRLIAAALGVAAVFTIACGAGSPDEGKPLGQEPGASTVVSPTPAADTTKYATPTVKSFKLTVKTIKKQCFGSAGCNVTYRIVVAYTEALPLDPGKDYEVSYKVKGLEDPAENTFTVTGDTYQVDEEEFASTKSSSAKITAEVTSVEEA